MPSRAEVVGLTRSSPTQPPTDPRHAARVRGRLMRGIDAVEFDTVTRDFDRGTGRRAQSPASVGAEAVRSAARWLGVCSTARAADIGMTIRAALERCRRTGDPMAGSTDRWSAGNGSLMRLAPVALRFSTDRARLGRAAAQQCRTTHWAEEAVDACRAFADMLADAISGKPRPDVLAPKAFEGAPKISDILGGSWRQHARNEIQSSGYVVHTLEAAIWSVARTGNLHNAVLLAANLADDADTVAAVTGQLAGGIYGLSGIPTH